MRTPRSLLAWYDELASFTKWWWATLALATVLYWRIYDGPSSLAHHVGQLHYAVTFAAGASTLWVGVNSLGFLRQGRMSRNVPGLLGATMPAMLSWWVVPHLGRTVLRHQLSTFAILGAVLFVAAVLLRSGGRRVLQNVVRRAPSLDGWTAAGPAPRTFADGNPLRGGLELLSMSELRGSIRRGTLHELDAAVFSGSCIVTAIPSLVDRSARIALRIDAVLSKRWKLRPEESAQTTRLFVTVVAVRLRSGGRLSSFDLRSKAHGDADVVFDNVADRVEHYESIDLDRNYDVRFPADVEQIDAWTSFSSEVIAELDGRRRVNLRLHRGMLIGLRIGGCTDPDQLDELVGIVEWFAAHV